jgi:hypothetical protein
MGQQPRKFDATRGAILANLSELLVRQIERRCEQGPVGLWRQLLAGTAGGAYVDVQLCDMFVPQCMQHLSLVFRDSNVYVVLFPASSVQRLAV